VSLKVLHRAIESCHWRSGTKSKEFHFMNLLGWEMLGVLSSSSLQTYHWLYQLDLTGY
jgi:hypothetical protein